MCKETVVLQSDHLIRRNILIMFLISSHSETATAGHLEGNLEYVTEVILCVLLPTCWQEGRGPSLARSSSHSGESPVQAKLSRTFSSAWARCLTTSRCRPSSARNTSSITCRTTGGKTKGRTDPQWNYVLTFALLCVLLNGNSEKKVYRFTHSFFLIWSHRIDLRLIDLQNLQMVETDLTANKLRRKSTPARSGTVPVWGSEGAEGSRMAGDSRIWKSPGNRPPDRTGWDHSQRGPATKHVHIMSVKQTKKRQLQTRKDIKHVV